MQVQLELTQEQLDTIKEMLEQDTQPEWPQDGDFLFITHGHGGVSSRLYKYVNYILNGYVSRGNAFKTSEEAEKHDNWLKARATILRRIREENQGWQPDWEDEEQAKYFVSYNPVNGMDIDYDWEEQHLEPGLYIKDPETAEKLAEELEDEFLVYFGVED